MKKKGILTLFILLFLGVSIFYPLITMLLSIKWENFSSLIASNAFKEALFNSLSVTLISTSFSIIIAYLLAYTINRINIKRKSLIIILITLPMLIPSISHGLGLINLFGTNGIISSSFNFNIIGKSGIVVGSILYSFPVAFLMLNDGFNYVDTTMYDNAKVLGLNKLQTFFKVTLCYLKKPFLSSIFAVFTLIFTDYGVPLAVGGKYITLPVFLYKEVIGLLDFSKGTMIGLFLLIPAFISFIFDTFSKDYTRSDANTNTYKYQHNIYIKIILKIFLYLVIISIFVLLGSFIYYAFINNYVLDRSFSLKHFDYVFGDDVIKYILNSLFISLMVSLIGTIVSYFSAYVTARIKGKGTRILHIVSIITLAIPGIVLGLAFSISFKNTFIFNTYTILVLVNIVHFMASPYLMAYNALLKVNSNYELVAKTFNISFFKVIKDVIIPITKKTIREMFAYFFVNSMITISAVTFLFNTKTMPLSLMINTYEGNLMLGEAAIISLVILLINISVKGIINFINRIEERKKYGINL